MLKKRSLYEVDYKDILKPETLAMLKGKSKQNLQQMLGDRSIKQALQNLPNLALQIQAAEAEYKDELEMVAKQIVTDAYPIIDYADIQIDAKIVPQSEIKPLTNLDPNEEDPAAPDFGDQDPQKLKAKRRIINGITQGAALKGTFAFLMFREYLDELDPTLVDKYMAITKAADVPYNDENVIPIMMAQIEQGGMAGEGQSEMVYDDETEKFTIIARATNFPVLVHEIVKGLYEITGTEGFGKNREKNQAIVKAVDKASNEPEDLQIGRYFEQAISELYNQSKIDDPRVRDFFFAEVYKLDEDEFLSFVENAVNGELEAYQKKWATNTMKSIQSELEGGEEDLYEDEDFDLSDNPLIPIINYNKLPVTLNFGYDLDNIASVETYVTDNYNVIWKGERPTPDTDAILWIGYGEDIIGSIEVLSKRLAGDKTFRRLVSRCDGKGDYSEQEYGEEDYDEEEYGEEDYDEEDLEEADDFDLSDNPVPTLLPGKSVLVIDGVESRGYWTQSAGAVNKSDAENVAHNIYKQHVDKLIDGDDYKGLEFISLERVEPGFYIVGTGEETFSMVFDRLYSGLKAVLIALRDGDDDYLSSLNDNMFEPSNDQIAQGTDEPGYAEWRADIDRKYK